MLQSMSLKRFKDIVRRIPGLVNAHLLKTSATKQLSLQLHKDFFAVGIDGKLWTEPVAGFPEYDNDLPTVPEE